MEQRYIFHLATRRALLTFGILGHYLRGSEYLSSCTRYVQLSIASYHLCNLTAVVYLDIGHNNQVIHWVGIE